jgi:hypothetical protein
MLSVQAGAFTGLPATDAPNKNGVSVMRHYYLLARGTVQNGTLSWTFANGNGVSVCKNAHSATRRDVASVFPFFVRNAWHATNRVLAELSPTNGPRPR